MGGATVWSRRSPAGVGEHCVSYGSEAGAEPCLQAPDRFTQRRLRYPLPDRGASEAPLFCDGDQRRQVMEVSSVIH
jgi:hypothetical protein